jgi:hypothetical protein
VFHYGCFVALLKVEGSPGAKDATRKGNEHERVDKQPNAPRPAATQALSSARMASGTSSAKRGL